MLHDCRISTTAGLPSRAGGCMHCSARARLARAHSRPCRRCGRGHLAVHDQGVGPLSQALRVRQRCHRQPAGMVQNAHLLRSSTTQAGVQSRPGALQRLLLQPRA